MKVSYFIQTDKGNLYLPSGTGRQGILLGPAWESYLDNYYLERQSFPIKPFFLIRVFPKVKP
ncbi:MAG: hypothetical protein Ct9H90mP2_10040 [Dehalococcoidia bacterium]|nr:MAG: hypothetical protein Ct9H90mP2_10040 [Dehalococcoidia bacterium]